MACKVCEKIWKELTMAGFPRLPLRREDREIFSSRVPENLAPSSLGVSVHAWKKLPYLALGEKQDMTHEESSITMCWDMSSTLARAGIQRFSFDRLAEMECFVNWSNLSARRAFTFYQTVFSAVFWKEVH